MEKVKTKISCYIFKAKIKTLSGTVLDSVDEEWVVFCSLSFVNCPGRFVQWLVTAVCRRSGRILMLALRHLGPGMGLLGKVQGEPTAAVWMQLCYIVLEKRKKNTESFLFVTSTSKISSLEWGKRSIGHALPLPGRNGILYCDREEKMKLWMRQTTGRNSKGQAEQTWAGQLLLIRLLHSFLNSPNGEA